MPALLSLLLFWVNTAVAAPFAQVIELDGLVSVEPNHVNLKEGAELHEGDRITVMAGGRLRIRFLNGAVAEVGPHSELSFKRTAAGQPYLALPHGSLLGVAKDPVHLEVRSGQIHLNLDSRAFYFEQRLDQNFYLCVCDGKAKASWIAGSAEISGHRHHHGIQIKAGHSSALPGPIQPRNHTDGHLRALRALL
jgi:hypothetical protein